MLLLLFVLINYFEYSINENKFQVGYIINVSLNLPYWSPRLLSAPILNGSCEECLCSVITNSSYLNSINSIGIGSFNCFLNNKTCQFYSKSPFYEYWLSNDMNTRFYFFYQPKSMFNFLL
jgi:hypothetical protein